MANSAPQFPPDAPSLGEGRYVLVSRIGQGAVGAVYRAYDRKLRVWRAVKVLLDQAAAHDWVKDQFEADAHVLAQLEHPNLMRVYDVGRAGPGGLPFVVMELVNGGTLAYWSDQYGPMPPRLACEAMLQVTWALCVVHSHGVVHGGVKPGNVLVAPNGGCKLTDFGIAAPPEGSGHAAPEQVEGSPIDLRADLYGVGAMLWHLLRGQDPSGRAVEFGGIPPVLQPIILRCTAGDREDRYPSGDDLAAALEEAMSHIPEDRHGTPDLSLDRSEEEVDVSNHPDQFAELGLMLDDARPRPKPATLPYVMPTDDPQRRRQALLTPGGGSSAEPDPEWVDQQAAMGPPTRGTPRPLERMETPPPVSVRQRTPDSAPPKPEPAPSKPRATPAPSASASAARERKVAPPVVVEPEDPPSRLVNWVLLPVAVVVAGMMCVALVVVMVAGMGMSSLSDAADATTSSQIELYRVLNEERRLVDELGMLGADRTRLEEAYVAYMEEEAEPARIGAALTLVTAVDEQAKDRLDSSGTELAEVLHHVREVRAAHLEYVGALHEWREAAVAPTGRLLITIGLGPSPP